MQRADIALGVNLGAHLIDISVPASDQHLRAKLRKDRPWLLRAIGEHVRFARDPGFEAGAGAEDASRGAPDLLPAIAEPAEAAGARRIRFADTLGVLDPFTTHERIAALRFQCDLEIEMHAHDDLGMATANTLAAAKAGATHLNTTVNGLGERSGNAPLEEVVLGLHVCHGIGTGIDLDATSLRRAVERDMVVDAVLERVAGSSATVSETEVEIFWFIHKDRFRYAETRVLRHILITVHESLAGSQRWAVRDRMDAIRAWLLKKPERFGEQALKHSECPIAMNGGLLGKAPRGQLYAELETVAFELAQASLSAPVESELGYHLLYCERIDPERPIPFAAAALTHWPAAVGSGANSIGTQL